MGYLSVELMENMMVVPSAEWTVVKLVVLLAVL